MTGARERRCALQAPAPRTLARAYQSDCWTKALNAAVGAVSAQLRACRDPSSRSSKVRGSFESSPRETASHTAVTGGGPRHWRRCWCRRRHRACALGGGGGWLLQSAAPRACRRARGEIGRPTTHASIWRRARARVRPARRGKKKAPPFAALGCKGVTKPLETSQAGPPAPPPRARGIVGRTARAVSPPPPRGGAFLGGYVKVSSGSTLVHHTRYVQLRHSGTPHSLRAAAGRLHVPAAAAGGAAAAVWRRPLPATRVVAALARRGGLAARAGEGRPAARRPLAPRSTPAEAQPAFVETDCPPPSPPSRSQPWPPLCRCP